MAKSPREKYYRIGEISRLYKISTDILRYYDKIGLMSPDFIGENGYRYYSKKQIWKLNNIRNLRNIGVGLEDIKEFLDERNINSANDIIEFQLEKVEDKIKKLTELKEELTSKLENIEFFKTFKDFNKPVLKFIPKRKFLRSKGNFKQDWEIDFELKILNEKTEYDNDFILTNNEIGATLSKENFLKGEYLTFSESFIINDVKGEIIPEGYFLTIVFKGKYDESYKYYNILKKYIEENNLIVTGDIHEIYHIEIHITENEDEFITEIQIPVAEQQK
ncbi:MerR family transcriptional regulator [Fusobacterium sp. SB021]|uniref:MerR family transcriptional regulator n=1 Tax=Fusobacterium sp. SB021 TaxID=2744227 RepID=UPI003CF7ABD4